MNQKITRQQEELQTLQKFIDNKNIKFNSGLVRWHPQNSPCDVTYDGIDYQITYGDQKFLGEFRKEISRKGFYCGMRNLSGNKTEYAKKFIFDSLKKKLNQSSDKMTLLIHCSQTGIYDPGMVEREKILKRYFAENKTLAGLWQHIFIVFSDGNIKLC